ncbi:HNH endonuclease [Streptomyces avermitilis]|uniref:HNH endonuclease n=1 Tax=Streptomyces avermitilis TaxID=33903 RepID=UPI0033BAD69F
MAISNARTIPLWRKSPDRVTRCCWPARAAESGWRELRPADRRVQNLSEILRKIPLHHGAAELGDGYIEVHHRLPFHISGVTETRIADLALLCANCHRMCHRSFRGESWRTPDALRALIRRSAEAAPHAAPASAS